MSEIVQPQDEVDLSGYLDKPTYDPANGARQVAFADQILAPYTLPTASASVLGGVKIGSRLTMTGDTLSADVQTPDLTGYLQNNIGIAGGTTLIGGTEIGDKVIYKSTTGAGTATGTAHQFVGGTDGGTIIATMLNNGNTRFNGNITMESDNTYNIGAINANRPSIGYFGSHVRLGDNTLFNSSFLPSLSLGVTANNAGGVWIGQDATHGLQFYWTHNATATSAIAHFNTSGYFNKFQLDASALVLQYNSGKNVGVGVNIPTATLHIKAGSATANTAPLKFTSGTLNTTAEAGATEFLTNDIYLTDTSAIRSPLVRSIYGSMYIYTLDTGGTTVTVASADTWYEITSGVTGGTTNQMTFQNNHELKVLVAGTYQITWALGIESATANQELEGTVFINSTANTSFANHTEAMTANTATSMGGSGIITLALNDVISLGVLNHTAGNNITIDHLTLSVLRVGA
jgi:hypothetical protein